MNLNKDASKKNLVLGIIDNYTYHEIRIFLLSLKKINYTGHVCLFAGPNISGRTAAKVRANGVEVIRYKKDFPYVESPHQDNFSHLPQPIHIYNFRHFLYYNYLLTHQDQFGIVLLTDVRDVVFQKDPFSFPVKDKIYVAVENVAEKIGQNSCTAKWINKGYGAEILSLVKDKEVICAGTTLAPTILMLSYLKRLIEEFFIVKDAYKCADQAMHNVLVHTNQIVVHPCYNFNGPFLTLDTQDNYRLNAEGLLIDLNGDVIPIIHQYDRHNELLNLFIKKYNVSSFWIVSYPRLRRTIKRFKKRLRQIKSS